MTGEEMRDQLAAVVGAGLDAKLNESTPDWWPDVEAWADDIAVHLLPVVRKIAANELRAAGDDKRMPRNGTNICRARAKALDPS